MRRTGLKLAVSTAVTALVAATALSAAQARPDSGRAVTLTLWVIGGRSAYAPGVWATTQIVGRNGVLGWEVAPDALYDLLVRLRTEYPPVPLLITENGAAYADPIPDNGLVEDPERLAYLRAHIDALGRAVVAGVDVGGYYAWSLFDNFEWEHGKRFGLVYVDYETQRRIPKQSGLWYRDWSAALRDKS